MSVRLDDATGRVVVAAAALGSGMTLLDGTVVNLALKTMAVKLDADLADLQWITNGYLLSLASFILLGGSLGDRLGRRRVFVWGTVGFAAASLFCGLAPNPTVLIVARVLQGAAAALLTPGSLAMIQGAIAAEDRSRAIGAWSGLGGIATAAGPLLGGVLVEWVSWRWIFLINLPLAAVTVVLALRVPETRDPRAPGRFDLAGAALAVLALGGVTWALIEWPAVLAAVAGVVAAAGFLLVERRSRHPMVPLGLFRDRVFSACNAMTLVVYAALGAVLFFLTLQLQIVAGWSPLAAGLAPLPITLALLFLASRGGEIGQRIGPRIPMTVGPLLLAAGTLLLLRVDARTTYWRDALPGLVVFGLGLALMVAPLTATVLAAAPEENAGIASGINNAVARSGSLLAVAALPLAVGLAGSAVGDAGAFAAAYPRAMVGCAGLLALGGLLSAVLLPARIARETGD